MKYQLTSIFRPIAALILLSCSLTFDNTCSAQSATADRIRFANEATDTSAITKILIEELNTAPANIAPQQRVSRLANLFNGIPYEAKTLEGTPEMLTIKLDGFDCTTLVETVMALAITASEDRSSWRDFVYNLERIRYRGGRMKDFASRLHYISEWNIDLKNRGLLKEVTTDLAQASYEIKTLDYITSHRSDYPALADDETFSRMKDAEIGYRSHRIPYIKTTHVKNVQFKEGDIVAFTCKIPGLDVSHIGIITLKDGKPYLIHASSTKGKVVTEKDPLTEYLRRNRNFTGIRVFRITDN